MVLQMQAAGRMRPAQHMRRLEVPALPALVARSHLRVAARRRLRASAPSTVCSEAGQLSAQVAVVLGSQWGDEGKGKLVDILAQQYDIIARAQVPT